MRPPGSAHPKSPDTAPAAASVASRNSTTAIAMNRRDTVNVMDPSYPESGGVVEWLASDEGHAWLDWTRMRSRVTSPAIKGGFYSIKDDEGFFESGNAEFRWTPERGDDERSSAGRDGMP